MPIKLLIPRSSDDAGMTDGSNSVPDLEIVDRVMIPAGTPPGEYVMGWRWDCEEVRLQLSTCPPIRVRARLTC